MALVSLEVGIQSRLLWQEINIVLEVIKQPFADWNAFH